MVSRNSQYVFVYFYRKPGTTQTKTATTTTSTPGSTSTSTTQTASTSPKSTQTPTKEVTVKTTPPPSIICYHGTNKTGKYLQMTGHNDSHIKSVKYKNFIVCLKTVYFKIKMFHQGLSLAYLAS